MSVSRRQSVGAFTGRDTATYSWTNQNLLRLILTGEGGYIQVDSTSSSGAVDSLYRVEFPSYIPPSNSNGMLTFSSIDDYNSFIKATGLMEDLWHYTDVDYQDTPSEIYHLGEESFNALDSALNFQSLRHQYELNEFYNYDWIDTAQVYVEDDDYQLVLNQYYELKIGSNYYKCIAENIIAIVNNSNLQALEKLRVFGVFANDPDISIYNEALSSYIFPQKIEDPTKTQGCSNFQIYGFANNITTPLPGTTQWTVRLNFSGFFNQGTDEPLPCVLADWKINWGDGTIETFRDRFRSPAIRFHIYTQAIAPGGSVNKIISINCQVVDPCGDPLISFYCPTIANILFTTSTNVILAIPPDAGNCMGKNITRKFYSAQLSVGGKTYRLNCKLKQKASPFIGFSHVTATVIFEKKKGNNWKKTKPIYSMNLNLRGKIYNEDNCNNVFKTMNFSKSTYNKKKLKIRDGNVPSGYHSRRSLPEAINADFIWYYNNGQTAVGTYHEVLKP